MSLAPDELDLLRRVSEVQEEDVVGFCIEFDLFPSENFKIDDVVDHIFEALVERAKGDGLPISKYDADDLGRFDRAQLVSFAAALGVRAKADASKGEVIDGIIRGMRRTCRRLPRKSQIPMFLTYFLPALVRHFSE